jgi:2-keto-3-deoxy-L-rhamnonate aldolase RhmA
MKGFSQKDAAQGVEGVDAVLPGRGDIAADTAEVHEGVKAAEGAEYLRDILYSFCQEKK